MDLSIVILNYKQKGLVKQCVKGIIAAQPKLAYELIIVDNASHDGCLEMVEDMLNVMRAEQTSGKLPFGPVLILPSVKTIAAQRNGGFAYGNNVGMRAATGRHVLVMNPDIAIVPGSLERMVGYMDSHATVGVLGPKLINPDGSIQLSCRRFPSWKMPLLRRTFLGNFKRSQQALNHYLMADWDHGQTQPVDWLFGACLLLRKSLLEKIGYFDERFFMYFEDLDLCRRCWEAGLEVWYLPEVELVHYHQRLSAERSGLLGVFSTGGRMHIASGIKYFAKYLSAKAPRARV